MSLVRRVNPYQHRPSEYAQGMTPQPHAAANDWADANPANNITLDALIALKDSLVTNLGLQIGGTLIRVQGFDKTGDTISYTEWQNNSFQAGNAMNAFISFVPDSDWVNAAQFKAKLGSISTSSDPLTALLDYFETLWQKHGRNRADFLSDMLRGSRVKQALESGIAASAAGQTIPPLAPFRS